MSKQVWGWVGVAALIILGLLLYNSLGGETNLLAAIPTGQKLPDVTLGDTANFQVTFNVATGSTPISKLMYRLEMYGPKGTDEPEEMTCYPSDCTWVTEGSAIQTGHSKSVASSFNPDSLGRYDILVYVGDNAATTDITKVYWDSFARSAYDQQFYLECIASPTEYGCTEENKKPYCCNGSGYYFMVVESGTDNEDECASDSDCAKYSDKPICDTSVSPTACIPSPVVCTKDSGKTCSTDLKSTVYTKCVDGVLDTKNTIDNCATGQSCVMGVCKVIVKECTVNTDCKDAATPICKDSTTCVGCTANSDCKDTVKTICTDNVCKEPAGSTKFVIPINVIYAAVGLIAVLILYVVFTKPKGDTFYG